MKAKQKRGALLLILGMLIAFGSLYMPWHTKTLKEMHHVLREGHTINGGLIDIPDSAPIYSGFNADGFESIEEGHLVMIVVYFIVGLLILRSSAIPPKWTSKNQAMAGIGGLLFLLYGAITGINKEPGEIVYLAGVSIGTLGGIRYWAPALLFDPVDSN